ncbi:MAG: hypothetical protein KF867_06015, partial [Cryobacterium sp.]|nr:hypothetical protein [Cryobacterium sp.]
MNHQRLVQGLGLGAAMVLAITGAIAGYSFGPKTPNYVATGTTPVSVMAQTSPNGALVNDDGSLNLSQSTAIRNVNAPAPASGQNANGSSDLLEQIAKSSTPEVDYVFLENSGNGESTSSNTDDPCSPQDGKIPAGCPSGLHSEIHRDLRMPDFAITPVAFPHLPLTPQSTRPVVGLDSCPAFTGSATDAPIAIYSTRPMGFAVRYIPVGNPAGVRQANFETPSATATAFNQAVAVATEVSQIPLVVQCVTLTNLVADGAYQAIVSGSDTISGNTYLANLNFSLAGSPVHPELKLLTSQNGSLTATALHPENQDVTIRAYVLVDDAAGPSPTCSQADEQSETTTDASTQIVRLPTQQDQDFPATSGLIASQNAPADFTRNQIARFIAPEGSRLLICARWYNAGSSPSWARSHPIFESSATANAPDRLMPKLTLTQIQVLSDQVSSINFTVTNVVGSATCAPKSWRTDIANGNPTRAAEGFSVPWTFCDETFSAQDSNHMLSARSGSADRVIWVEASLSDGSTKRSQFEIPGSIFACGGICAPPADTFYNVSLGTQTVGRGMCSSNLGGDCTPPTREQSLGVAQVKLSWLPGRQTGLSDWTVSPVTSADVVTAIASVPQLDTNTPAWTFTDPTPDAFRVLPTVTGTLDVVVDRSVDYTLRFLDGSSPVSGVAVNGCDASNTPLVSTGHIDRTGQITMPNICVGHHYYPELELTDSSGAQSVWSMLENAGRWDTSLQAPSIQADVTYQLQQGGLADLALTDLSLSLGRSSVDLDPDSLRGCTTPYLVIQRNGTVSTQLVGEGLAIHLEIRTYQTYTRGTPGSCRFTLGDAPPIIVDQVIPLNQLRPNTDITITLPMGYLKISTV